MCSLVKPHKALDEVPDLGVTGKQRLFQFRKEVFDQKCLKETKCPMEAQEKAAPDAGLKWS